MGTVDTWGWIDAPVGEVVEVATDVRRLPDWFAPVRAAHVGDRLAEAGDVAVVDWRDQRGPTTLRVTRRTRDVVHLAADDHGRVCLSFSAWDGGTAVELSVDVDHRAGAPLASWQLSRSIRRLAGMVGTGAVAAASASGRRSHLVPGVDAAHTARS